MELNIIKSGKCKILKDCDDPFYINFKDSIFNYNITHNTRLGITAYVVDLGDEDFNYSMNEENFNLRFIDIKEERKKKLEKLKKVNLHL